MLLKIFFAFFISCSAVLFSGIEELFKPAVDKHDTSFVKNVDFIYIINLDQRPEKFSECFEQLSFYGIYPYRFSAFNGWELTANTINQLGVPFQPWMMQGLWGTWFSDGEDAKHEVMQTLNRTYFCHRMTKGAIGIVMSHLSILQDAYDAGYETIWVMEDDIQIARNPHLISTYIEKLDSLVGKEGWDIFFTDSDTKGRDGQYVICRSNAPRPNFTPSSPDLFSQDPPVVQDDIKRVYARYGAYSMIIRRSGVKKLLDFFKTYRVFLPYDMDFYLVEGIKLFGVTRDIVSTKPDALSDNGKPGYIE